MFASHAVFLLPACLQFSKMPNAFGTASSSLHGQTSEICMLRRKLSSSRHETHTTGPGYLAKHNVAGPCRSAACPNIASATSALALRVEDRQVFAALERRARKLPTKSSFAHTVSTGEFPMTHIRTSAMCGRSPRKSITRTSTT